MGTNLDLVQRTVILHGAMVCALIYSTLNRLVCLIVHDDPSLSDVHS